MDASGPVEVRPPEQKDAKRGAMLVYADGVTVTHEDGFGVDFLGSEGRVQVNRGRFTFTRMEADSILLVDVERYSGGHSRARNV